jgi:hypothetical protein
MVLDGKVLASVEMLLVNAAAFVAVGIGGELIKDVGCFKTSDIACLVNGLSSSTGCP